jgi:hypothetical protein
MDLNFNEDLYFDYFASKPNILWDKYDYRKDKVLREQKKSFLSKALYYEFVSVK